MFLFNKSMGLNLDWLERAGLTGPFPRPSSLPPHPEVAHTTRSGQATNKTQKTNTYDFDWQTRNIINYRDITRVIGDRHFKSYSSKRGPQECIYLREKNFYLSSYTQSASYNITIVIHLCTTIHGIHLG